MPNAQSMYRKWREEKTVTKKTRILISVLSALLASFCFFAYVQSVRAEAEKSRAEAIQKLARHGDAQL